MYEYYDTRFYNNAYNSKKTLIQRLGEFFILHIYLKVIKLCCYLLLFTLTRIIQTTQTRYLHLHAGKLLENINFK